MFAIKMFKTSYLAIALLSSTTAFANNTISCAEYALNAIEREGLDLNRIHLASSTGRGVVGISILTATTSVTAMDISKPKTGSSVFLAFAGAAFAGGIVGGGISYLITSNFVDIINLSDEVELGGTGVTIQTLINSIEATLPSYKLNDNTRDNIRNQIINVIKKYPQICDSGSSDEVLKNISEEVKQRL